jgi:type III secretion protein L
MWVIDGQKKGKVVPGKRVLRSDEFLAIRGSAELIADAERTAGEIIAAAQAKARELETRAAAAAKELRDSTRAAFDAEKERGHGEGVAEGKREMALQMMEMTAKNLRSFSNYEDVVLNIVMRSLRRIVGEMGDTELIKRIVSHALQVVRNQKKAILKVNPDQAPAARESVAAWTKQGNQIELLEVVADGRLGKSCCLVETEIGTVDASLEVQMDAIRRVLEKTLAGT